MNAKRFVIEFLIFSVVCLVGISYGEPGNFFRGNTVRPAMEPTNFSFSETGNGAGGRVDYASRNQDLPEELKNTEGALCYMCHDRMDTRAWVHGPVAVGECTICHENFHGAGGAENLVRDSATMCFKCHDQNRLGQHIEDMNSNNCVDCHNPHSSEDYRLLWQ